jgi:hypothetical protein
LSSPPGGVAQASQEAAGTVSSESTALMASSSVPSGIPSVYATKGAEGIILAWRA